jgi:hypothetical protein
MPELTFTSAYEVNVRPIIYTKKTLFHYLLFREALNFITRSELDNGVTLILAPRRIISLSIERQNSPPQNRMNISMNQRNGNNEFL